MKLRNTLKFFLVTGFELELQLSKKRTELEESYGIMTTRQVVTTTTRPVTTTPVATTTTTSTTTTTTSILSKLIISNRQFNI